MRKCLVSLLMAGALIGTAHAQDKPAVAYDVSAVRPHDPADESMSWNTRGDRIEVRNVSLRDLVASAWGLRSDQVTGEAAWADDEHWDLDAKITEADAAAVKAITWPERQIMLRAVLADRFHLKAHGETRTGPVFNLLPAKGGVKLVLLPTFKDGEKDPSPIARGSIYGNATDDGGFELRAHYVGMDSVLANIAGNLRQTVIDRSGVPASARFDFKLHFAPEGRMGASPQADAPPLRDALEQQLGLHLEATRGPVQVVVVDHVERPTEN